MEAADLKAESRGSHTSRDGRKSRLWSTLNLEWKEKSTNQDISSIYTI